LLFIDLFGRGDGKNKFTTKKMFKNKFFIKKIDILHPSFVYKHQGAVVLVVCKHKLGCKIQQNDFLYAKCSF